MPSFSRVDTDYNHRQNLPKPAGDTIDHASCAGSLVVKSIQECIHDLEEYVKSISGTTVKLMITATGSDRSQQERDIIESLNLPSRV